MAVKKFEIDLNEDSPTLANKQDKLVSSQNIKTINNESLLGSGNINISIDTNDFYTKNETDNKFETIENHQKDISNLETSKQNTLINQQNIKSINNNSLLGSGNLTIENTKQFSDEEAKKLRTILDKTAFGINKVTNELEQRGTFSQQIIYNDLDKPSDNMVTDNIGNDLTIRRRENIHYAQNMWYDENGDVIFENYQGLLTYKGNEIATKKDIPNLSPIINNIKYWIPVSITGKNTKNVTVFGDLQFNRRYRIGYSFDKAGSNIKFIEYLHLSSQNSYIDKGIHTFQGVTVIGITVLGSANVLYLANNASKGFEIGNFSGSTNDGFIYSVEIETELSPLKISSSLNNFEINEIISSNDDLNIKNNNSTYDINIHNSVWDYLSNNIYQKYKVVSSEMTEYIFEEFDNSYSYLFNVEYISRNDRKAYSGTLERPAGVTINVVDTNVAQDFSAASSNTLFFSGETKKLEVRNWGQLNATMTKITIFRKNG